MRLGFCFLVKVHQEVRGLEARKQQFLKFSLVSMIDAYGRMNHFPPHSQIEMEA